MGSAANENPSSRSRPPTVLDPRYSRATAALGPSRQENVLLNATGGVLRAIARLRPTDDMNLIVRSTHRRAVRATRRLVDRLAPMPSRQPAVLPTSTSSMSRHLVSHRTAASRSARRSGGAGTGLLHLRTTVLRRMGLDPRLLKARLGSERTLPIVVAFMVVITSIVSLGPAAIRTVGAAQGTSSDVRLAIGGVGGPSDGHDSVAADQLSAYFDDGTFWKPVAVDTTVESGSGLLRHYTVRNGDTLTGIASHFGISMMTLWWANKITSKDQLHVGQSLIIPPVNGLVVTVKVGDTLDSLAAYYKVDSAAILDLNELTDPTLVVGQILIMPGAKGAPIPTPKPVVRRSTSTTTFRAPSYTGGAWAWPVVGGGNYISQYFHYGHLGVDIAAKYGTPIVAALGGTVVQAGWLSGGGGYQVFIYHGNGMYTAYLHMSAVLVSKGQSVGRGQQIGRVGMTGNATGPHCHFAVSFGFPWRPGSYFVNPLRYY